MTAEAPLAPGFAVGRRIGIAGLASLIGGVLVLGGGGRLAMRLSGAMAIVNDPGVRMRLTGDGFRIGLITIDGSLGLLIFGGIFGSLIAAGYWALLKPHLPRRRGLLIAGLAAAAIGGNAFVKADNVDFVILRPVAMNVALYPFLSGLAGIAIVAIDRKLERRPMTSSVTGATVLTALGLIGAGLLLTLVVVAAQDEPWMSIELILLGGFTAPIWLAEMRGRSAPGWIVRSAPLVAFGVVAVEWIRLGRTAWQILA